MSFTIYGLMAGIALAVLFIVARLFCLKAVNAGQFLRFTVLAVPLALVGSRLVYVLSSISYYTETIGHPEMIFALRDGGETSKVFALERFSLLLQSSANLLQS